MLLALPIGNWDSRDSETLDDGVIGGSQFNCKVQAEKKEDKLRQLMNGQFDGHHAFLPAPKAPQLLSTLFPIGKVRSGLI
jgi:hypothetical protein